MTIRRAATLCMCVAVVAGWAMFAGCGSTNDSTVAQIGDHTLTLSEFERQYLRNNGGKAAADTSTLAGRIDFLNLLVKYRLKVLEAKARGYDKDPEIRKELDEYRTSLAVPYLTERVLIDPMIETLYKRRLEEVRAAHILIRVPTDSLGRQDTVAAYKEANRILLLAKSGERFDSLAAKYSQDQGTAKTGGDLLYFMAGMTVPAFDNAVYSMQPGEIFPRPVRTMFGYHIIKLLERKPTRGEMHVSHIMTLFPRDNPNDTAAAYARIAAVRDSLRQGVDFAMLARRNSQDPSSAQNGGDIGWVGRRRLPPDLEAKVFSMKVGEVSDIIRTPYGYHIVTLLGERTAKPFEESRQELKDLYRRYGFDDDNKEFIASILQKYHVNVHDDTIEKIASEVDTTATTAVQGWQAKITDATKLLPLVTLQGKTVTVADGLDAIGRTRELQSKPLTRSSLRDIAGTIGQQSAFALETADLETRYPEFGELMKEYREGVLLFRAEQDAVWNRVAVKDSALRAYWEQHRNEYRWPQRVRFREIFVSSDSLARVLRDSLNAGVDFAALASRHTERAGYRDKGGDWGLQPESANELSKTAMTMQQGWIEGPIKNQYGFSLIKMEGKEVAREKTFEEAQSEVSSKFQEYESKRLEREWIDSLAKKFGVTINADILKNAFRNGTQPS